MGLCQSQPLNWRLEVTTWHRQTHNLFDSESIDVTRQQFDQIQQPCDFVRSPANVNQIEQIPIDESQKALLRISHNEARLVLKAGKPFITMAETGVPEFRNGGRCDPSRCWLSTRSVGKVRLQRLDVFRLGRMTFRVWDFVPQRNEAANESFTSTKTETESCRICLRGQDAQDPLLNLCRCTGSLKYVHLECVKHWLRERNFNRQTENCHSYLWKDMRCEICQAKYEPEQEIEGQRISMNDLLKPQTGSYLILEYYCKKREGQQCERGDPFTQKSEGILVVKLATEMGIGRASGNHIRVKDVSMSRFHALLLFQQKDLFLQDLNSRYGALVLQQQDMIVLPEHHNVEMQTGRTVFKLQLSTPYC